MSSMLLRPRTRHGGILVSSPLSVGFKFATITRGAKVLRDRRFGRCASSRCLKRRVARRDGGGKRAMQPRRIGRDAGELRKRLNRLMHAHAAAVERAGAFCGGGFEEFGLHRRVDDVGGPMGGL